MTASDMDNGHEQFDELQGISAQTFSAEGIDESTLKDNTEAHKMDIEIYGKLSQASEKTYIKIAERIVSVSTFQLNQQNRSKSKLKKAFSRFFIVFLSVQYAVLVAMLACKAFCASMLLSETVIITYITSLFIETLGAVILMIKYAFNSDQEVKILEILNGVISSYKKFNQK